VEAGQRGDPVWVRSGDPQAYPRAHAVAGDRDRPVGHRGQLVQVGAAVRGKALRRQLAHQGTDTLEEVGAGALIRHVGEGQDR